MAFITQDENSSDEPFIRCFGRKHKNHYNPVECDRRLLHAGNGKADHGND